MFGNNLQCLVCTCVNTLVPTENMGGVPVVLALDHGSGGGGGGGSIYMG